MKLLIYPFKICFTGMTIFTMLYNDDQSISNVYGESTYMYIYIQ